MRGPGRSPISCGCHPRSQNSEGADTLDEWKKLKDEGKVLSSDEMERDAQSARMGSEGLIAERIDENLPYIDQGYVGEDQPDFMAQLGKLFGKKE